MQIRVRFLIFVAFPGFLFAQSQNVPWAGYAHDPQHTAISATAAQTLHSIHWQTAVDQNPTLTGGELLIHYGSLSVTAGNTVLVPVKTSASPPAFEVMAFNGATGALVYTLTSDYSLPPYPSSWIPSFGPALSLGTRLYYPGPGGTVYYRDQVNSATGPTGQVVFYGKSVYQANQSALNAAIQISTPITADHAGNIFFGFIAAAGNHAGTGGTDLVSGIARIGPTGVGTWASATSLANNDSAVTQVSLNCAPALSINQLTVYVAVSGGTEFDTNGYLVSLNASNLKPVANKKLYDPSNNNATRATVSADSSATPMVGPDGDVYYGVLESGCCGQHNARGWMLHFNSTLSTLKTPGSFGWDHTPSVVPASSVPSYTGTSSYLILTKYNDYNGVGTGHGINEVAVLDPNGTQPDEYWNPGNLGYAPSAVTVMKEIITVTLSTGGAASSEWCINTTAVDPATKAAIINSENGNVYRWDFTTNSLLQSVKLTNGLAEAYTPTAIGPDGTVFAINDATLFAVWGN